MGTESMTERFEMRLGQSVLEKVDSWRATQDDLPSRSEAVRRLLEAGLRTPAKRQVSLGDGEKLILIMLCDLFKQLKLKGEIEPDFVEEVMYGGHYWGLEWKYSGIFHGHEDSREVVAEVVDVLDMWSFLESGFAKLSKKDKGLVATGAAPLGEHVAFAGFDGNNEAEYCSVAGFLINKLDRFTRFKGRELNSHMPAIAAYRRMLAVFEPMRCNLAGRELNASEIIQILAAWVHPSRRKGLE